MYLLSYFRLNVTEALNSSVSYYSIIQGASTFEYKTFERYLHLDSARMNSHEKNSETALNR